MKKIIASSVVVFLSACGGGSASDSAPEVADFPVDGALASFFSRDATYTVNAKDPQIGNIALTYRVIPTGDKTIPELSAAPLKAFIATASAAANGAVISSGGESYYTTGPFLIWGSQANTFINKMDTKTPTPTRAKPGASGPMAAGTRRYESFGTVKVVPNTITWSLERDTAATAWLCINIASVDDSGPATESDCARIDAAGAVSGFKSTVTTQGITLTFK